MIDLFTYAEQYPHLAGHRNVSTSVRAANKINRWVKTLDYRVLQKIKECGDRGVTSGELAGLLAIKYKSAQPATSRLKARGLIADSGRTRHSAECENAETVWIMV